MHHNQHTNSTETVLLKVRNDVTLNMDKGKVTALTLLDLSAAFDTIDHTILINRVFVVWCMIHIKCYETSVTSLINVKYTFMFFRVCLL